MLSDAPRVSPSILHVEYRIIISTFLSAQKTDMSYENTKPYNVLFHFPENRVSLSQKRVII